MYYSVHRFGWCLSFLLAACQQQQEKAASKTRFEDEQVETGALFYWPGSSSAQTFGHCEPGKRQFIVDSTTNRNYEVKILGTCLDIVAQGDTVLAMCNDVAYGKPSVARLLNSVRPLHFLYTEGKGGKDELLISEAPDRNGRVLPRRVLPRRAVVLQLTIFPVNE